MSTLKTEIIRRLRECKDYVSGQEICEEMGVSRTAVWKAVKSLKDEGFEIESVSNRGYMLKETPDVLTKSEIESRLKSKWLGKNLYCFDEIDSTNNELKRGYEANHDIADGTLAVTDNQTAGRGRRGRNWDTPVGVNIAMSFLLKPNFTPDKASMITILAALSVAKATEKVSKCECKIKWPNDVLINNRKYCGILTEMSCEADYIHYAIVGIGINVNTEEFPEEIAGIATSVYLEKKEKIQRAQLVAEIITAFEEYYEEFCSSLSLKPFIEEYDAKLASNGRGVRVLDPKGEFEGVAKGINEEGELIVEKTNGETAIVYSGEVSVRGIYGYI